MKPLSVDQLLELCDPISIRGGQPPVLGALRVDSRLVESGDVFLAVRGANVDGHDFIGAAVERGAAAVISEADVAYEGLWCLQVEDSRILASPLALAEQGNPQKDLTLIGVTGTNGKTTVSTLVWQVLSELGYQAGLIGTVEKRVGDTVFESKLTTPGPLELASDLAAMRDAGCSHVAMEVSSHALEQGRTAGLGFKVACYTNLTLDHLDYHGDMEAYAAAKRILFDGLAPEAHAVVNIDDAHAAQVTGTTEAQRWELSFHESGNASILENSAQGLVIDVDGTVIASPLCGHFNAYNVATAWLACVAAGISPSNAAAALATANGAPGRMERVDGPEGSPAVFVDYAHTPDALENVLRTVAEMRGEGEVTVVFGCGGNRDRSKRPKMGRIAADYAQHVVATSDNPRFEDPEAIIDEIVKGIPDGTDLYRQADRRLAIAMAVENAGINDIVLVAGKGHETYQEVQGVRHPMDDREIAREALKARSETKEAR